MVGMLDSSNGSCAEQPTKRTSAVIYARMSFEHQQYSTENQCDVIREYAARHDMDILRTYTDEGKSGLRLGRIFEENSAKSLDL
ncbi:MAG: recombinase family protein [Armatimonadetes bacterium]|nr:recombinase family protein [Armatimonadota bacterium]